MSTDEEQFESCFCRLYAPFKRYAWGELGSEDPATDVTASTLEALWQRLFVAGPNPFVQADTVAFRMLKRRIEGTRRTESGTMYGWAARARRWIAQKGSSDSLADVVQRALDTMRPRCREVFLLRREAGMSFRDIAFLTGTDVESISALMHRAQFVLRDHVDRAGFGADARLRGADTARWKLAGFSREPELFESQEALIERGGNPDSALISDYVAGQLAPDEARRVADRLEADAEFRAIAEPLLVAWSVPPRSRPVAEAEIHRARDAARRRLGMAHDGSR